jgi:hypothetical protein
MLRFYSLWRDGLHRHRLVMVAPLLNDSFMCGGMENADRSKEVWPAPSVFLLQDVHELIPHGKEKARFLHGRESKK